MDTRRLIIGSAFFVASILVLSLKLLLPTPINVYVQQNGNPTLISQVPGFYSWSDVMIVLVAAVVLGWSGSVILSSSSRSVVPEGVNIKGQEWNEAFEKKKAMMEDIAKTLKEDEATVLRMIIASDGTITQGELVERTGLPKSTVSTCLDALEVRGIVERRRRGMGNLIVLK